MGRVVADIISKHAPDPVGAYPHAKRIGQWLYLSGVGPRLPNTNEVPGNRLNDAGVLVGYDIEAQCHSVLANIRAILESAGAGLENLVDITVYLTDMAKDFKKFNAIYSEYFQENQPCRTTVEVNALPTDIAIEMKCIAYLGEEIEA